MLAVSWLQLCSRSPRRKSSSAPLLNTLDDDDDDVSTDGETYFSSSSGYKRSSSQDNILSTFSLWTEPQNVCVNIQDVLSWNKLGVSDSLSIIIWAAPTLLDLIFVFFLSSRNEV